MHQEVLIAGYDAVLSDLDGVVYAGPNAIPGAVHALQSVSTRGISLAYVTNNASRSPEEVAAHLRELGAPASPEQVFGSAPEGAALLANRLRPGSTVLVSGSSYLREQVIAAGLTPVDSADDRPDGVIQGFDPSLAWADLAEAAYAVARGAVWVATNADMSLPGSRGTAPGNGALVAAVSAATGTYPEVAGKPEARLFNTAAKRLNAERPLVVGDRLDTDIRGGNRANMTTALVLTGVNGWTDALVAPSSDRPNLLLHDLPGLFAPYEAPEESEGTQICGQARAHVEGQRLYVDGDPESIDLWRAACAAWWARWPDASPAVVPELVVNGEVPRNGGLL